MRALVLFTLLSFGSAGSAAAAPPRDARASDPVASDWTYVARKLTKAGFPRAFVKALRENYDATSLNKVVELNVLLYLRIRDDHGPQVSDDGSRRVRAFLDDNRGTFAAAEARYRVDPAVIASLLYIESRFGGNVGRFHVASVYLNLLQSDRPAMIAHLRATAPTFRKVLPPGTKREVAVRAARKAAWALTELKALRALWTADRRSVASLRGSFSGAVGMPQFLPSSLRTFARAARPGRTPDLTRADDAIASVAHYLSAGGWRPGRPRTHAAALFKYNRSTDYGRAILSLADRSRASGSDPRRPAAAAPGR